MGVTFWCPHCRNIRLGVAFKNPIDGGTDDNMTPHHDGLGHVLPHQPVPEWVRSGDTFEDLTLSPSVDTSASGHWHGFITNGSIC
jgi:hypothetical protein